MLPLPLEALPETWIPLFAIPGSNRDKYHCLILQLRVKAFKALLSLLVYVFCLIKGKPA